MPRQATDAAPDTDRRRKSRITPAGVLARYERAKARRAPWETHWREAYEYVLPVRESGVGTGAGAPRADRLRYLATVPPEGETHAALQCRQVAALAAESLVPAITIETNGVGRFLPSLLRQELAAAGVGCAVVETASRTPKALRIAAAFDAVLAARNLYAHAQIWATPFATEMREWRPEGAERAGSDDGLDAVAGCLLAEPVRLRRLPPAPRPPWRHTATLVADDRFEI